MIDNYNKLILDNLSGQFQTGTATAILGPSGCGKTTLLNFLSGRMRNSGNLAVKGGLFINGRKENSVKSMKHRFSYVTQDDIMYEDLSPYESILNTAQLAGIKDPEAKTNEIIKWLGLGKCKDTRVGGTLKRGVSGGEKKRTSIALEVITNPSLIFLDEPTTGLDSKSALDVASILRMLARNGRTIVTTIHQPSSEILSRFDKVLCLCEGKIVYDGPPANIPGYFAEIGYPAPPLTNPADHLMSILNDDDIKIKAFEQGKKMSKDEVRFEFLQRLSAFNKQYESKRPKITKTTCSDQEYQLLSTNENNTSTGAQACIIFGRAYKYFFRNPNAFITKCIQLLAFAFFGIILYTNNRSPDSDTIGAIQDVSGMVFNLTGTIAFGGIFGSILGIIPLLGPFLREHEKRLYSPTLFYIISTVYHLPS